jgi:transcriptional regulator GlxA family with amidase domain
MARRVSPPTAQRTPPRTIRILAFDDNDELDVIAPYEMLVAAGKILKSHKPDVRIVSVKGTIADPGVVRGIHGLTFGTQPWKDEKPDILIVAGGGFGLKPAVGIMKQMHNPHFTKVIREQHAAGRQLVSVCTGAFGLAGAGVINGRRMTTHPVAVDALADPKYGAHVLNPDWEARVVDDGDIISCGGVTSGTDEALYLVEAFWPGVPSLISDLRAWVDYYFVARVAKP